MVSALYSKFAVNSQLLCCSYALGIFCGCAWLFDLTFGVLLSV